MTGTPQHPWYYAIHQQQYGPVDVEVLREMLRSGRLTPSDLVWHAGMDNWKPAWEVPELNGSPSTAPRPSATPGVVWVPPATGPGRTVSTGQYGLPTAQVQYAGFWLRFVAAILDIFLLAVGGAFIGVVFGAVLGAFMGLAGYDLERMERGAELMGNVLGIIIGWLYAALMESSRYQATLGKMALGLKVTDLQGRRISFARATGRHFAKWISGLILMIGYIMAGFTEKKQALHDMIASTLVVRN